MGQPISKHERPERKIHLGEAEPRSIHGQADPAEMRSVRDDGIEVLPLPVLPEDRNGVALPFDAAPSDVVDDVSLSNNAID